MDLIARRLHNQGIGLGRYGSPEEVVSHLVAVQSQDYLGAAWGVGLRSSGLDRGDVDAAFDAGRILRTHVLRPTWHFVTPADAAWLLELTAPRVRAQNAGMYRQLGLDERTLARAADVIAGAVTGGRFLTREELKPVLAAAGLPVREPMQLGYLLMHAELTRQVISGPRKGKRFSYASFEERAGERRGSAPGFDRDAALAELARRFAGSRGPVSAPDLARWAGLTLRDARRALALAGDALEATELDGVLHWFGPGLEPRPRPSPRVHLLSVYDEYLAGYQGWEKIADAPVIASLAALENGLTHVVLLDGRIVGSWRRDFRKARVAITTRVLTELTVPEREALARAAERYGAFFGVAAELLDGEAGSR